MADYLCKLRRARAAEQEVIVQLEHIERIHRIMKRPQYTHKYTQELLEKLTLLEREVNEQIDATVDAKREALVYISALEGEERAVIYSYYILAKSWEKISEELYTSERRVFLLRKSAMDRLERLYGNRERENGNRTENSVTS